jgi:hypothetical protein
MECPDGGTEVRLWEPGTADFHHPVPSRDTSLGIIGNDFKTDGAVGIKAPAAAPRRLLRRPHVRGRIQSAPPVQPSARIDTIRLCGIAHRFVSVLLQPREKLGVVRKEEGLQPCRWTSGGQRRNGQKPYPIAGTEPRNYSNSLWDTVKLQGEMHLKGQTSSARLTEHHGFAPDRGT